MSEQTTVEAEVFLAINEDGGYEVGTDADEAGERLDEQHGGYHRRIIKLVLTVPLPRVAEVVGVMPERQDVLSLEIKEAPTS